MSAAVLVLTSKVATVTVTAELAICDGDQPVPVRYILTGSSGYQAIIPACICERRTPCPRSPGHAQDAKHSDTHCHGWHLPGRVETFAVDVLKTYPRAKKARHEQPALFADIEGAAL